MAALKIAILAAFFATAWGQAGFEVASVKPAPCDQLGGRQQLLPPGRFEAINVPIEFLIQQMYQIRDYQLIAAPEWKAILAGGRCAQFTIQAIAPAGEGTTEAELREMVKGLLAERFALKMHKEQREMDAYVLTQAKGGVKAKRASGSGGIERVAQGWIEGRADPSLLISAIAREVDRPIMDQTGHQEMFAFRLTWTQNTPGLEPGCPASFGAMQDRKGLKGETWDCPTIFKALEEQVGLKLERKRAPVDVWVVDHVERASEN
jgi:uncharacterized protein (TIGR03435 family)